MALRHYVEFRHFGIVVPEDSSVQIPLRSCVEVMERWPETAMFRLYDEVVLLPDIAKYAEPKRLDVSGWYYPDGTVLYTAEAVRALAGARGLALNMVEHLASRFEAGECTAMVETRTGRWLPFHEGDQTFAAS